MAQKYVNIWAVYKKVCHKQTEIMEAWLEIVGNCDTGEEYTQTSRT